MTREKNEGVSGECKARAAKKNCITIYIDLVYIPLSMRVLFLHTRVELNFFIYSVAILAILSPCTKLRLVVIACSSSFYFCCEQFFAATTTNCNWDLKKRHLFCAYSLAAFAFRFFQIFSFYFTHFCTHRRRYTHTLFSEEAYDGKRSVFSLLSCRCLVAEANGTLSLLSFLLYSLPSLCVGLCFLFYFLLWLWKLFTAAAEIP